MKLPTPLKDMGIMKFSIRRPRNSFFSKLSELSASKLLIETIFIPSADFYMVFAYSYGKNINTFVEMLKQSSRYLVKGRIRRLKYYESDGLHFIVAIKSMCEFLKIAEDSNIVILTPYLFDKGVRRYIVIGERRDLDIYIDRISRYYGEKDVFYTAVNSTKELINSLLGNSILNILSEKLTDTEFNIIRIAYQKKYFEYPRGISQEAIGSILGLSKITINVHMRKAIKKIIDEMMKAQHLWI